jgi:hypothetical protein
VACERDGHEVLRQLALEIVAQVHRSAPRSHLTPLLLSALVLAPASAGAGLRLGRSRTAAALGALAGTALALAVSLTVFRGDGSRALVGLSACVLTDPVLLSSDGVANLVLFAPAAFLAVLAIGRPVHVVAGVAAVSLAVEALQQALDVGVCDSSDALLNTVGGVVAAVAAALLRAVVGRVRPLAHAPVPGSGPCRRSC